ncbi:hypothetical protein QN277_015516 [Acacia crassicarpa]|uniref:Uncharacterized protein n=1 Tax=Acacia crassicarpa TaxID=499986 RepID=A0AAE1K0V7_9FABA|nr:hypothetical protein QN277_015516 [Acacia crassicarpa]
MRGPDTHHSDMMEADENTRCSNRGTATQSPMGQMKVKTFKDAKGCDDAKQEITEAVEYLKNPANSLRGHLIKLER